jgi:predicted nucleotidyltransferase component of viral defense system
MKQGYTETVQLLIDIAPFIFASGAFVLKGGTAINLFVQDMPRLSVDIDLVYRDGSKSRDEALKDIQQQLELVRQTLNKRGFTVPPPRSQAEDFKLMVSRGRQTVKVEANTVFRGTVLPPVTAELREAARAMFKRTLKLPMLAVDEIYASKLVAAMDRQHPRDLFDVMKLRESHGGISNTMRQVFLAYVSGHNRPINEILTPNAQDISHAYANEFVGMTVETVSQDALEATRTWLFETLPSSLTMSERQYLRSVKMAKPDWSLLPFPGLADLPSAKWKLQNIEKLQKTNRAKYGAMLATLEEKLYRIPFSPPHVVVSRCSDSPAENRQWFAVREDAAAVGTVVSEILGRGWDTVEVSASDVTRLEIARQLALAPQPILVHESPLTDADMELVTAQRATAVTDSESPEIQHDDGDPVCPVCRVTPCTCGGASGPGF